MTIEVLIVEIYRLDDINKSCLEEFRKHWTCLDNNNQQLWQCRKLERGLNKCVFDNLVRNPLPCESEVGRKVLQLTTNAEAGEGDTGDTGERGAGAPAKEADIRT